MRSPESSESKLRKRTRSSGSSPAVGSSTIKKLRIVEQRLRDPDALPHAARITAERTLGDIGEIHKLEQFRQCAVRAAPAAMPFTAARYSRNSSALRFGYTPKSCGK